MAHRAQKKPVTPAAEDPSAADGLAALNPDVTLTLAGRAITMREYGFFEGLDVAHRAAGFIADMHAMCAGGALRYSLIRRLFGVHQDVVVAIAAQAADVEPEWLRGLGAADAEVFMSSWFAVNSSFFVHEVVVEMREERHRASTSTGSTSSPVSPPPALATSTGSVDSPSVN